MFIIGELLGGLFDPLIEVFIAVWAILFPIVAILPLPIILIISARRKDGYLHQVFENYKHFTLGFKKWCWAFEESSGDD